MKAIGAILVVVGYICMALAVISGLGYGVYLLGPQGLTLGMAAWGGFVLFLKMFFGGLISLIVGAFATAYKAL